MEFHFSLIAFYREQYIYINIMQVRIAVISFLIFISSISLVKAQSELDTLSLEEISRKLENPLTNLWSLTFQENFYILSGDFTDNKQWANNFFFQPFLPFPVGEKYMLTFRPVFPLVTSPVVINDDTIKKVEHQTGLGDIQLLAAFGPSTNTKMVWGIGATFIFPSATTEATGDGKWAAGPAATAPVNPNMIGQCPSELE